MSAKRKSLPTKISQARSSEESLTLPVEEAGKTHLTLSHRRNRPGRHSPEPVADSDLDYEEEEDESKEDDDVQSEPEESNDVEDDPDDMPADKEVSIPLCHSLLFHRLIETTAVTARSLPWSWQHTWLFSFLFPSIPRNKRIRHALVMILLVRKRESLVMYILFLVFFSYVAYPCLFFSWTND